MWSGYFDEFTEKRRWWKWWIWQKQSSHETDLVTKVGEVKIVKGVMACDISRRYLNQVSELPFSSSLNHNCLHHEIFPHFLSHHLLLLSYCCQEKGCDKRRRDCFCLIVVFTWSTCLAGLPSFPQDGSYKAGAALITLGELDPWSVAAGMEGDSHLDTKF